VFANYILTGHVLIINSDNPSSRVDRPHCFSREKFSPQQIIIYIMYAQKTTTADIPTLHGEDTLIHQHISIIVTPV